MQTIQSRIKSRRILGVGVGASGEFHTSKISQILGNTSPNNWKISQTDYPLGLQILQLTTCLWFTVIGLIRFLFPERVFPSSVSQAMVENLSGGVKENADIPELPEIRRQIILFQKLLIMETRFYGAALLGLASLCIIVTFGNWRNRRAIRIVLLVVSFFLAAEFLASCCSYHSIGDSNSLMENLIGRASWSNSMQMIIFLISMYYYVQTAAPSSESLRSKRTD